MNYSVIALDPYDTLWFRDGKPFDQTDDGLAEARVVFPPSPTAISGAIAAAIAMEEVSDGNIIGSDWRTYTDEGAPQIRRLLHAAGHDGNYSDQTSIIGPFLITATALGPELWCPFPSTLMVHEDAILSEREDGSSFATIKSYNLIARLPFLDSPKPEETCVSVPVRTHVNVAAYNQDIKKFGDGSGLWIRFHDLVKHLNEMSSVLNTGDSIGALKASSHMYHEARMGVSLDEQSRTALSGQLFTSQHLRPRSRFPAKLAAVLIKEGEQASGQSLDGVGVLLGGKGRLSRASTSWFDFAEAIDSSPENIKWRKLNGRIFFRITAITPVPVGEFKTRGLPLPPDPIAGSEFWSALCVHCAAIPSKPDSYGAWRSLDDGGTSILKAFAAGSTWFVSVDENALTGTGSVEEQIRRYVRATPLAGRTLGARGFGWALAGDWPSYEELKGSTR